MSGVVQSPASGQQFQFWLLQQLQPETTAYNIPCSWELNGNLDILSLEAAFRDLAQRHGTLRTTFTLIGDRLHQCEHEQCPIDFLVDAAPELVHDDARERAVARAVAASVRKRFDLEQGPLWQVRLWQRGPHCYTLLWTLHHSIVDLTTKSLFSTELSALYRFHIEVRDRRQSASESCCSPQRSAPSSPLAQYAEQEAAWTASSESAQCREYFAQYLSAKTAALSLFEEFPRPTQRPLDGGCLPFDLDSDLCAALAARCSAEKSSPFLWLLAAWGLLLSRFGATEQVVVGVPFSNRRKWQSAAIAGCFVKTLPVVVAAARGRTFQQLLGEIRAAMLEHHRHQEIAFTELQSAATADRDPANHPLYQAGFTFEPPMALDLTEVTVIPAKLHNGGAQLNAFMTLWPTASGYSGHLVFATDRISAATAQRILDSYAVLLTHTLQPDASAHVPLERLQILSAAERSSVVGSFNATQVTRDGPSQLTQFLFEQARQREHAVAVRFRQEQLTYGELYAKATQLAQILRATSWVPGEHVGLYMLRSTEMVIGIWAILIAGGIYLPLDPDYPELRIAQMLQDAQPRHVLSHAPVASKWSAQVEYFHVVESRELATTPIDVPPASVPNGAAYTIFTSGSTGRPKGATNTHLGIINRILWMQQAFQLEPSDVVLQKTPFSFDVSAWEFFWPVLVGATLEMAPPGLHRDPGALCQLIEDARVTTIHFVPSMLDAFLNHPLSARCYSLRRIFASGEALTPELVRRCAKTTTAALHNLYGPTEAAVDVTWWPCAQNPAATPVPIGRPIANTQIYILEPSGTPAPIGVPGELYIGGVQVALGYVNRPELTAERFIANPFSDDPKSRLYRTGDLAQWLPDGNISYLGRLDCQVKYHGNRIELGEIEHALDSCPQIRQSVVVLHAEGEAQVCLLAYVRLLDDVVAGAPLVLALREQLLSTLPGYMVPAEFITVSEFPLTASGKIDRRALPVPVLHRTSPRDLVLPSTDMEIWLRDQVRELLHLPTVCTAANLFEIGGNSIMVAQLVGRVFQQLALRVPLVKFFEYPTISDLAKYLSNLTEGGDDQATAFADTKSRAKHRRELTRPVGRARRGET